MEKTIKLLLIEDSEDDAVLLIRELRKGGFMITFRRVDTEKDMRAALCEEAWDMIISDHSMPYFSAPAALSVLKESCLDLPFVIISAAIGEEVAVEAMKAGASDYIMKRNLARLVPVVERELREARNRRERRIAEENLRKKELEYRTMILKAYEEERGRLARELHDEIGQSLSVINLDLQYLKMYLPETEISLADKLSGSINLLGHTLNNVRRLIIALRPPALDRMGLVDVVKDMAREVGERAGFTVDVQDEGFSRRVSPDIETTLYRCIQEALTNVIRHARARQVSIKLSRQTHQVAVSVQDDGIGFEQPGDDSDAINGVGLAGINERVALLEGTIHIETAPHRGVKLSVSIPLRE